MLVSKGYASLAELWTEFSELRCKEVYRYACTKYTTREFAGDWISGVTDEFGSPKDLLEEISIKSFGDFKLTVCAPDGTAMHLPSCVADGSSAIFQRLFVMESTIACEELADPGLNNDWLNRMGSCEFAAWPHKLRTAREWSGAFPAPTKGDDLRRLRVRCRFHRLPIWFERHQFVVSTSAPFWTNDAFDSAFAGSTMPKPFGWSICLEDRLASKWKSRNIRSQQYRRLLGQPESESAFIGRPSKQEHVLECLKRLYPDGRLPPWKVVYATLSERCDLDVSVRTAQRAINGAKFSRKEATKGLTQVDLHFCPFCPGCFQ